MLLFGGDDGTISGELWTFCPATGAWKLVVPTGSSMSPRYNHTMVWDPLRHRALVFGGVREGAAGLSNELWSFTPATNTWNLLAPNGPVPAARGAHTSVWDPVADQMLVFAGQFGDAADLYGDLWSYSAATNSWREIAARGTAPGPRQGHSAVWVPGLDRMLVFGGWDFRPGTSPGSSDIWSFDPSSASWSLLAPSGPRPPPRFRHAAVWDTSGREMLVFAGCCAQTGWYDDLWAYDPSSNSWADRTPQGQRPPYTNRVRAAWDAGLGQMLVFGGIGHCFLKNDMWAYVSSERSWRRAAGTAVPITRREGATAVYDAEKDEILVFGGCDGSSPRSDVIALSALGSVRGVNATTSPPPARTDHGAAWDPIERVMYVFGGRGPAGTDGGYLGDLWRFRPSTAQWELLPSTGLTPRARADFAMAWDLSRRQLLLFGGATASGPVNDLWAFRPADGRWVELGAGGDRPTPRAYPLGTWDATHGWFLVYGGWRQDERFGKVLFKGVWAYDPATDAWRSYPQTTPQPSLRHRARIAWDGARSRLLLFGGEVVESNDVDRPHVEDELWAWVPETNAWSLVRTTSSPTARYQYAAAWDAASARLFVVGGYGNGFTDELWEYASSTNVWRRR